MTAKVARPKDIWYRPYNEDPQRVVAIEYQDGWPANVLTELHWDHSRRPWFKPGRDRPTGTCPEWWDFNWSKAARTLYFHNSGGGGALHYPVARFVEPDPPPGELWVAPGVPVVHCAGRRKGDDWHYRRVGPKELLKRGYVLLDRPRLLPMHWSKKRTRNPFEAGEEGQCVYCGKCDDWVCEEDRSFRLCEHAVWCDSCTSWVYEDGRERVENGGKCDCEPETDED